MYEGGWTDSNERQSLYEIPFVIEALGHGGAAKIILCIHQRVRHAARCVPPLAVFHRQMCSGILYKSERI